MKFLYFLLSSGVVFSSIYLFSSGLPQIADIIFLVFSILVLFGVFNKKYISFPIFFRMFLMLVVWITLVSLIWGIIRQSFDFVIHPLFYIYNFILCFSIFYLLDNYKAPDFFRSSFLVSVVLSVCGVFLFPSIGRATGFFNNPNQLAFFSLCMLCIISVLYDFKIPMKPLPVTALISIILSIFAASSIAGLIGLLIFSFSYIIANITSFAKTSKFLFLALMIFSAFSMVNSIYDNSIVETFTTRMDRADSKVDNIYSERKYDRIIEFNEYLFLGAGEGDYDRFLPLGGGEIHSSYGNLIFSYGIVGLTIFMVLVIYLLYKAPFHVSLMTMAPLFYSISHMGLRSSYFWILLSLIYYFYIYNQNNLIKEEY